ncbi:hypothetical protein [Actinoplanes solisilvae]|uniref:hypothetical protein n=1 Tax=Actinoplanes solisilvae TaxID=2486853 RepID=UPI000FDC579A|nr:hypothetical protein [Actinoplanes solisilvae]
MIEPLTYRATPDEWAEWAAFAEHVPDADDEEAPDAGALLEVLVDGALHQGFCYPHTAAAVPGFVALATDERVGDYQRAWILVHLFSIATVGRRDLCRGADTQVEAPEAVAARRAVAGALPRLTGRWDDESEGGKFFLAALVAACPEAGVSLRAQIGRLREAYARTTREATLRLVEALADADPQQIDLRDISPAAAARRDSPHCAPENRGLSVLEALIIEEIDASWPG